MRPLLRLQTLISEYSREYWEIDRARRMTRENLLERLRHLFVCRRVLSCPRNDDGPEFTATKVRH